MSRLFALVAVLLAATAAAASPRITFSRLVAPRHAIGSESATVVYVSGDLSSVELFVDTFVDRTNRTGMLHLETAGRVQALAVRRPDASALRRLNRLFPTPVYLSIEDFSCRTSDHEGEGSAYNADGARIKRHQFWSDATCKGRIAVMNSASGSPTLEFDVAGEGTSPRVTELTEDERRIAVQQAARFAAVTAADVVTPRRVRESIDLIDSVPDFDRAMALIDADKLSEARQLLEEAMKSRGASAAIHFDIAAITEAMGDAAGAQKHYATAAELAPTEKRYARELTLFLQRSAAPVPQSASRRP